MLDTLAGFCKQEVTAVGHGKATRSERFSCDTAGRGARAGRRCLLGLAQTPGRPRPGDGVTVLDRSVTELDTRDVVLGNSRGAV